VIPAPTKVLIGSVTRENKGAIPTITRALIDGLQDRYAFIPHYSERRYGLTATANVNFFNLYYFVKHFFQWVSLLLRNRPDIVHYPVTSHWNLEKSSVFLLVAKLAGAKTVGHLNGGSFDVFWGRLGRTRRWIGGSFLRGLDAFVVTGERWRQWSTSTVGLEAAKVFVVTNPIDQRFEQEALSFPPTDDASVFFVGSLGKRKGVFDILEAAAQLDAAGKPAPIFLSGPEDRSGDLARIRSIMATRNLTSVRLLPGVYGEEKLGFFRAHGIFLFPSHNENLPLVVLEAAAAGRAIITTRAGALSEFFVHGESLLFVEPGNIGEITSALGMLRADAAFRQKLGLAARKAFLRGLANTRVFDALDDVYRTLLGAPHQ
jgi:glycosyltransferase involved in cell wall biosynthesis